MLQKGHLTFKKLTLKFASTQTKLPMVANIAKTRDFVTR
jgi:hypothetical protein